MLPQCLLLEDVAAVGVWQIACQPFGEILLWLPVHVALTAVVEGAEGVLFVEACIGIGRLNANIVDRSEVAGVSLHRTVPQGHLHQPRTPSVF